MAQEINLELGLAPYDPWILKKNLTYTDLCHGIPLLLPKPEFEASIIPEMEHVTVHNVLSPSGAEVKLHFVEEGHEADGYTVTLFKYGSKYMFKGGWSNIAKAKGYKIGDQIGFMWDKSYERFLFHHIQ